MRWRCNKITAFVSSGEREPASLSIRYCLAWTDPSRLLRTQHSRMFFNFAHTSTNQTKTLIGSKMNGRACLQSRKTKCLITRAIILGFLPQKGLLVPLSVFWALALQSVEDLQMHWYTRNEVIFGLSVGKALFFHWWCLCARVEYPRLIRYLARATVHRPFFSRCRLRNT